MASTKVGARAVVRPIALSERQRTGKGIKWIIEASHDKPGKQMQVRLAKEMVAVIKGQSSALRKKEEAHKSAMVARYVLLRLFTFWLGLLTIIFSLLQRFDQISVTMRILSLEKYSLSDFHWYNVFMC